MIHGHANMSPGRPGALSVQLLVVYSISLFLFPLHFVPDLPCSQLFSYSHEQRESSSKTDCPATEQCDLFPDGTYNICLFQEWKHDFRTQRYNQFCNGLQ